jgi:hypothetical protein
MDPLELASEHAPCYARRGRIEPPPTKGEDKPGEGKTKTVMTI